MARPVDASRIEFGPCWHGAAAVMAALILGLLPAEGHAQTFGASQGETSLAWGACPAMGTERLQRSMECATLSVPLDHGRPLGPQLPVRVERLRASGPGARLGTLVLIDGAPGAADALNLGAMARALPSALRSRFDLVSWQRRGTGRRGEPAALHCWPSEEEAQAWRARQPPSLPVGPGEESRWLDSWAELARACQRHQGPLLPHLSSADSARDLELLRQALGEATLRIRASGVASLIGATYANLYPRALAALVLDGPVDPFAWGDNGNPQVMEGTDYRLERDLGTGATLIAFVRRCAAVGRPRCAFAPTGPGGPEAGGERRYAELLARLRQGPLRWGERRLGTGEVFSQLRQRLQSVPADGQGGGWEGAGRFLEALLRGGGKEALAETPPEDRTPEQALALRCGETPNPRQLRAIQSLAERSRSRSGPLGAWVVWADARCASWPAAAAPYRGPWNTPTPVPVLVIGHRFDPVMPFQSSLAMARELSQGQLLSVNGYGHTVLRNPSACVARHEVAYILSGGVPPLGTVCGSDSPPFGGNPWGGS
ncbi:MAG: alpha/beta hydrolase [Cyanobacteriota bacterium]|nr:alpha/beta hydrolase [Cyanobacteriota bacterium]